LLVVIAIVGVLMGLLLPAVQKVREAAARAQCTNNLKQIGLACLNFESDVGGFPMAPYNPLFPWTPSRPYEFPHGWAVEILPYLDQGTVHKRYNFNLEWQDPGNAALISTQIPCFICPATPSATDPILRLIPDDRGPLDYIVFFSVASANKHVQPMPPPDKTGQGILGRSVNRRVTEILDGTSNTLLMVEDAGRNRHYVNGALDGEPLPERLREGGAWANCCMGGSVDFLSGWDVEAKVYGGACAVNCTNGAEVYSFHPGGANVAMGDGSVHFLSQSTDINALVALLTRAGGEATPSY
jgi:prepilin-type processing-associated H-X9-DG protein